MRAVLSMAVLAAAVYPPAVLACGSASCLLSARPDAASLGRGGLRFDVSFRYMDQDRRMFGDDALRITNVADPTVLRPRVDYEARRLEPGYHQEFTSLSRFVQVDVSYGLSERVTLIGSLPLVAHRRTDHLFFPGNAGATHQHTSTAPSRQGFTTSGMGDALLSLRYRMRGGFFLGAALQLPTGGTDLRDEYDKIADPMHQPGTGALGAIVSASTSGRLPGVGVDWLSSASYQRNAENGRGYRFGDEALATLGLSRLLGRGLSATLQVKGQHVARNRFWGQPSPSTGGAVVSVAPGLRWRGPRGTAFYAALQLPMYQYVNEGQLATRAIVTTGVSLSR